MNGAPRTHRVVICDIPVDVHAQPGSHARHAVGAVALVSGWYVPARQFVGAVEPARQYAPSVHGEHPNESTRPVSAEYVPAGHG